MIISGKQKLLLTGASGFLGNSFAVSEQKDWKITGLYHQHPIQHPNIESLPTNLEEATALESAFEASRPDAVIHLAALSNPNYCEAHPDRSKKVNVDSSVHLARLCQKYSIPFLFTSTDLVFDGTQGPYRETDPTNGVNLYGRHKAMAEVEILKAYPQACIARCPVMFGLPDWSNSFMKSWLETLEKGETVFAFTDEYRTKVSGATAVEGLLLLLKEKAQGIWHLGGRERLSRYDFAILMTEVFELPKTLVKASRQADVQMAAVRPADVSLDSRKAFQLGYQPPLIREELLQMKRKR